MRKPNCATHWARRALWASVLSALLGACAAPGPTPTDTAASPIDSLEIVGVGISVETWRNHPSYPKNNLWTAVEQSKGAYIISDDPRQYPKDLSQWQMMAGQRNKDMSDMAMRDFMDRYPLPIAVVSADLPTSSKQSDKEVERVRRANAASFVNTGGGPESSYTVVGDFDGLLTQAGQVMNSYLNDNPDKLWNTLFTTFDEHLDIPAVGVGAADDVIYRALPYKKIDPTKFQKMAADAYRPKHARILSDSQTMIAMVRRERIDWLRPYADAVLDHMTVSLKKQSRNWSEFAGWLRAPAQPFVPTPFIPKPWTRYQIDQFDHLEILGRIYRPQVVSYLDEHGKPVSKEERKTRMEAALRAVLTPVGGKMPARLFYDYNSVQDERNATALRYLPFVGALSAVDSEWDLHDPQKTYNLTQILGDLGAGSPFVSVALASMAGVQSGGATLIANLRRDDGATLLLVTPPTAEERKRDAAIERPFQPGAYARIRKE